MAKTKLKGLEVNEVSLVDAGANQHAHVKLYKRRDGKEPEGETQPQEQPAKGGIRKLLSTIGKALNVSQEEIDSAVSEIEKSDTFGEKMEERKLGRVADEIWDVCLALESSLRSILYDDDTDDRAGMMNRSVDEFTETIKTLITSWADGKSTQIAKAANGIPVEHLQEAYARLGEAIAKEEPETNKVDPSGDPDDDGQPDIPPESGEGTGKGCQTKKSKGGIPDMKFREDMMTPADKLAFEHLKKNYGIADGAGDGSGAGTGTDAAAGGAEAAEPVGKGTAAQGGTEGTGAAQGGTEGAGEDIYKGLHPLVAAELKELRKRADEADEKELMAVAKRYEIIGKKPEELVPMLKALKAAGGTAYADMIGVLDGAVATVEKSGVFGEIGKRGNGTGSGDAWSRIEKHAEEIRKAAPELGYAESIDRACIQHPELVAEYESSR